MKHPLHVAALALILLVVPATAQPAHGRGKGPPPGFMPPHLILERLSRMSPEERQRMLDRMPPERRRITEERLKQLDSLPPEDRERLRKEFNEFQSMPSEKQQELRGLFRRFSQVPEDRRSALRRELWRLKSMQPGPRAARLGDEHFRSEYSDEEREMLERMAELLPDPPPGAPRRFRGPFPGPPHDKSEPDRPVN